MAGVLVGHYSSFLLLWSFDDPAPPPSGKGYVATRPSSGPTSDFVPRFPGLRTPRRNALYSHPAHLLATSVFVPRFEALGTPRRYELCSHFAQLRITSAFVPHFEVLGTP